MKELRSKRMRGLMARGIAKTHGKRPPNDGMMIGLINESLPNGWHYQVEWVHDTRFQPKPWVVVYGFSPGRYGIADYFLRADKAIAKVSK